MVATNQATPRRWFVATKANPRQISMRRSVMPNAVAIVPLFGPV
jgi:hypothetical protein